MSIIFEKQIILYILSFLGVLSIGLKFLVNSNYTKLLNASDKMGQTNDVLMKTIQKKFETSLATRNTMNNVDIFVDKYVYRYKIAGLYLYTWENLSFQMFVFCMIISVVGSMTALGINEGRHAMLSTLLAGFVVCGLWILVDGMLNINMKREMIHVNVTHYLDNICRPRMESQEKEQRKADNSLAEEILRMRPIPNDEEIHFDFSQEEERIIEEVLREYMA